MSASVSIGFVTWRTPRTILVRFLDSLAAAVGRLVESGAGQVAVYALCNDGPEGAAAVKEALAPHRAAGGQALWEFICGQGNVGYGAAQNLAIRRTRANFHFISNPDVVMAPDALLQGLQFLQAHPCAVAVGPQGHDAAGQYAKLAKRMPSVLTLLLRALSAEVSSGYFGRRLGAYVYSDRLPAVQSEPVELLSGCFMACRTSALRAVGGFDPRYFLYFEDFDLCRRLAAHGEIRELPTMRIRHYGGRTARRGLRRGLHFTLSGCRFFSRYGWRLL